MDDPNGAIQRRAGELRARLVHIEEPMVVGFGHSAKHRARSDSLVLELTGGGVTGIGECAPRPYVSGETSASVSMSFADVDMAAISEALIAWDAATLFDALAGGIVACWTGKGRSNELAALVEGAVIDFACRRDDLPVQRALGVLGTAGRPPTTQPADLPISQVADLAIAAERFLAERGPFHFVKVKASQSLDRDLQTVRAIRAALGREVPLMVDANMGWRRDDVAVTVTRLRDAGVDLFEEPLPKGDLDGTARLRRETGAFVMLDESVCTLADAERAVELQACDAINVRISKCGGLITSAKLVDFARSAGLSYQIGVQVAEIGPLLAASRALAFQTWDAITLEAGQSDRFFPHPLVEPLPSVDRTTNRVSPHPGPGFGMTLPRIAGHVDAPVRKKGAQVSAPAPPARPYTPAAALMR